MYKRLLFLLLLPSISLGQIIPPSPLGMALFAKKKATVYYGGTHAFFVDDIHGNDNNRGWGTSDSAWKTRTPLNAHTFTAGDTISFRTGGSWSGEFDIAQSGTSVAPIVITSYGKAGKPRFSNVGGGTYATAFLVTGKYVTIDGVYIEQCQGYAVHFSTAAGYDTLRHSEVNASGTAAYCEARGIYVSGNYIHDLIMTVNDAAPYTDYGAVGVWMLESQIRVIGNTFERCVAASMDYQWDGGMVEIYQNNSHQVDSCYVFGNTAKDVIMICEVNGDGSGGTKGCIIAYNTGWYRTRSTTNPGMVTFIAPANVTVSNLQWYNNVFVQDFKNVGGGTNNGMIGWDAGYTMSAANVVFSNNIFVADSALIMESQGESGVYGGSNNYYFRLDGVTTTNAPAGTGTFGDPLLTALTLNDYEDANFVLQSNSPCINAGIAVGLTADRLGQIIIGPPDIGAFETTTTDFLKTSDGLLMLTSAGENINVH